MITDVNTAISISEFLPKGEKMHVNFVMHFMIRCLSLIKY